jgi:hypothetical protein
MACPVPQAFHVLPSYPSMLLVLRSLPHQRPQRRPRVVVAPMRTAFNHR